MSSLRVPFPSVERPGTTIKFLPILIIATAITIGIFGAIWPFKGTFIRDLMIGRQVASAERIIFQGLTTFCWALSTATIVLKFRRLKLERRMLASEPIPPDFDIMDEGQLAEMYEHLTNHPGYGKSITITRSAKVLAMWINSRDFERSAQLAKEENELDAFLADSSYRANRLFIWAMPLLGFVGTVYGVSYGIGGFAEFLRGQVTAEEIKFQVGLITEGLAVAFYTTLLGLWTAGAAAFPSLGAERKEESVLGDIDELIQDRLISRMPSVRKTEFPTEAFADIRSSIDMIRTTMQIPVDDLTRAINEGFSRMPDPRRYEEVFSNAISGAANVINQKYGEFMIRYEHRVGELGKEMAGHLATVSDSFREGAQRLAGELESRSQEISKLGAQQASSLQAMHTPNLASLEDLRKQAVSTADRHAARLAEAASGLDTQAQRILELGQRIDHILQVAKTVQTSMDQVAAGPAFRDTLEKLRGHLETTDQALKQLAKPKTIVLQENWEA